MDVAIGKDTGARGAPRPEDHVRLVYHYRDGHDFTTETMLRTDAVAYMPLLNAVCVDPEHYEASFAQIELRVG
ncbi:hypothetical protein [Cellulomonas aerilata]|nr:hypothetical protein [Cellulomonas aerilata]